MTRRRWMAFFFALGSACFLVGPFPEPTTGSMLDLAAANWNTSLGAACFLACAVDTLQMDKASKMPLRRELREFEHELDRDLRRVS
jgi:hypothetical protein